MNPHHPHNDTYIAVWARYSLYAIVLVGGALLVASAAYQAHALDRQIALDLRV